MQPRARVLLIVRGCFGFLSIASPADTGIGGSASRPNRDGHRRRNRGQAAIIGGHSREDKLASRHAHPIEGVDGARGASAIV
jgi:hypothetical protein